MSDDDYKWGGSDFTGPLLVAADQEMEEHRKESCAVTLFMRYVHRAQRKGVLPSWWRKDDMVALAAYAAKDGAHYAMEKDDITGEKEAVGPSVCHCPGLIQFLSCCVDWPRISWGRSASANTMKRARGLTRSHIRPPTSKTFLEYEDEGA